jgi:hypothetical protein
MNVGVMPLRANRDLLKTKYAQRAVVIKLYLVHRVAVVVDALDSVKVSDRDNRFVLPITYSHTFK